MKEIYKSLKPINNFRVINLFIGRPREQITKEEVEVSLREFTGSSDTGASLKELSKKKLLIDKTDEHRRKSYMISSRSDAYRDIFCGYSLYKPERVEELLKSNYTNYIIKKRGFKKIYETIKIKLQDNKFKKIGSVILNHPATHEEYERFADNLQKIISHLEIKEDEIGIKIRKQDLSYVFHEIGLDLSPNKIDKIDLLKDFEPASAVRFYREHIHKSVQTGLDKLRERDVISEGLHDFLVIDNYLSPLSSYPVNGTLQLLFAQPFQRLYEDIYLLDGEGFGLMSLRAAAIYNNFADIIFELIKNDPPERAFLEATATELIFHWNVASTRFDFVCDQLARLNNDRKEIGNYHLGTDGLKYKIANLDDNSKQQLDEKTATSILIMGSTPFIFEECNQRELRAKQMEDPFTSLRPCMTFQDMGWKNDFIPIEEIVNKLELRLSCI